jgi:CRISPR-associated protein Cas1
MVKTKSMKLILDGYGSYLGMEKGCFIIKDRENNIQKYPLFEKEIDEVVLKSGNTVSIGALASLGFWDIDVLILTQKGKPVAMLKSIEDDTHVKTRICQYEAIKNGKGIFIAKQIVLSKFDSQNIILEKYDLKKHDERTKQLIAGIKSDNLESLRRKLTGIEGKYTQRYYDSIFKQFPEKIRPEKRETFLAYDGINNIFNLAYEILSWKIHRALIKAKLEPYLGFLHSIQWGKPSLICDFQELYRYLIDDFLIQYCQNLKNKDFIVKTETISRKRKGKREYLNDIQTRDMLENLNHHFQNNIEIPRIRIGQKQTIETLINEEALLLAKYLRNEKKNWIPRLYPSSSSSSYSSSSLSSSSSS